MNKNTWRKWAAGVSLAALSLGFNGCATTASKDPSGGTGNDVTQSVEEEAKLTDGKQIFLSRSFRHPRGTHDIWPNILVEEQNGVLTAYEYRINTKVQPASMIARFRASRVYGQRGNYFDYVIKGQPVTGTHGARLLERHAEALRDLAAYANTQPVKEQDVNLDIYKEWSRALTRQREYLLNGIFIFEGTDVRDRDGFIKETVFTPSSEQVAEAALRQADLCEQVAAELRKEVETRSKAEANVGAAPSASAR